jgi:hypothetical protein
MYYSVVMKLTSTTLAFIAMILFCGSIFGQTPKPTPDFNGHWRFKKIEYPANQTPLQPKKPSSDWDEIVIVHKDTVVLKKMSGTFNGEPFAFERTYYTDNRGETNPIQDSPVDTVITKTELKKDVLVTEGFVRIAGDTKNSPNTFRTETRISSGGKEMKFKNCSYLPKLKYPFNFPELCTVYIYTRVP